MRQDPVITALVARDANGQEQAWDALVDRYAPLIWSICRSHRLGGADAGDVGQRVWLQLVDLIRTTAGGPGLTRHAPGNVWETASRWPPRANRVLA
jgi:DNA-directed RNA polymerase specialized sigma24 family protein